MPKGKWLRFGDVITDDPFALTFGESQYQDKNGVIWHFKVKQNDPSKGGLEAKGGYSIESRPMEPGDAYKTKVGRYPVALWSSDPFTGPGATQEARDFTAESIDTYVDGWEAKQGGGWGWLIALALLAMATSKRRR